MGIFSNPARDEQGNELRRRRTDQIPFSIIASDMTVIGDLETEGVVRIEGRVKGTVRVGAQMLVDRRARSSRATCTPRRRSSPAR